MQRLAHDHAPVDLAGPLDRTNRHKAQACVELDEVSCGLGGIQRQVFVAGVTGQVLTSRDECTPDALPPPFRVDRKLADKVFCEALGVCGVPDDKATLMYMAVRMYSEATT